jgi:CDGSH-type Zn-finger protein/ferredoxin
MTIGQDDNPVGAACTIRQEVEEQIGDNVSRVKITESEDGPLLIDGQINLVDAQRNELPTRGKARLCRCGMSSAKPFCNNSHISTDFGAESGQSEEEFLSPKPISRRREYSGSGITVSFDASLCIHVAECLRQMPDVFDVRARPWINLENANPDQVAEVVRACPSGALRYKLEHGETEDDLADGRVPTVRAWRNGPLRISGLVEIVNKDGETVLEGTRASLCRCGASRNKPFCDNSHMMINFESDH